MKTRAAPGRAVWSAPRRRGGPTIEIVLGARRRGDAVLVAAGRRAASSPTASASGTSCSRRRRSTSRSRFLTDGLGFAQSDWLETEIARGHQSRGALLPLQRAPPHRRPRSCTVRAAAGLAPRHVRGERSRRRRAPRSTASGHAELPIPNGLGRHDNDGMFSFYLQTPAGLPDRGRPRRPGRSRDDWDDNRLYDAISAWGHQPLRQVRDHAGPTRSRGRRRRRHRRRRTGRSGARGSARPARSVGRRPRAVVHAVHRFPGGALRPRGRPHPPVVRHR